MDDLVMTGSDHALSPPKEQLSAEVHRFMIKEYEQLHE